MSSILGLDRAAMEQERLSRLAGRQKSTKRERSITPPPLTRPSKILKSEETDSLTRPQVVDLRSPSPPSGSARKATNTGSVIPNAGASSHTCKALMYPDGNVKQTWAFGHPRTNQDVKIEEVLEKDTLKTAVLSAFQWDTDWVFSKIDMTKTKLVFVMQAKEKAMRDQMRSETADLSKVLRLCFPPMDGQVNCMHSKLMLLFHEHKLRIAVPSANLMKYDWGETGIMENSVFMIDLPRLSATGLEERTGKDQLTSFGQELLYFLEKSGLDDDICNGILNFDFTATERYAFIHTAGGVAYGKDAQRTGYLGLSKQVREHSLSSRNPQIDFIASSIGSLNDDFLDTMYTAAQGRASIPQSPPKSSRTAATKPATDQTYRDNFRIYFPSHDTVANSTGGTHNGGTICFQRKWWENTTVFPRSCFRDFKSVRKGMLSHKKILYARGIAAAEGQSGEDVAWAYVGSANLSESAWGKLVWDRTRKEWKMNCRNWECGVLVPVPAEKPVAARTVEESIEEGNGRVLGVNGKGKAVVKQTSGNGVVGMAAFTGVVDVGFEFPGKEYTAGTAPWFFME